MIPNAHLSGQSCSKCKASKGETKIETCLKYFNISYQSEIKLKECKYIRPLPFDFGIFNNTNKLIGLIEYHGMQHYKPIKFMGGIENFKIRKKNDLIKQTYCLENNIPLLVISYNEFSIIEKILISYLYANITAINK